SGTNNELNRLSLETRQNNLNWNISLENNITSHRKIIGRFIVLGKKVIRKFLRWYINPLLDRQREFNGGVTRSLSILEEFAYMHSKEFSEVVAKIDRIEAMLGASISQHKGQLEAELTVISDRLRRLERKINKGLNLDLGARTLECLVKEDKQENLDIDYFLFEQRFRGSREDIKERQKVYLDYFRGKTKVLDIGCGRGEFIELLMENGVGVQGIDLNEDMVGYCQDHGLPVLQVDLFEFLEGLEDNSLDGIFAAQVIEHLEPKSLIQLSELCYKKLRPSGTLVLETINPGNLQAVNTWFYLDPSHVRPVSPELIKFITEAEGFKCKEVIYLSPIKPPLSSSLPQSTNLDTKELYEWFATVDSLVFGPQDYALIAIK
ncbi:MAG: class I SAM-dependent methyltransferase, partial [Desulfitobacteriaceae bacterium]